MAEEPESLSAVFAGAEKKRELLDATANSNANSYQETLSSAIVAYERCLQISDKIALFSPNETLEDVSSGDIPYFLINYRLADLFTRSQRQDRKDVLVNAQEAFEGFLKLLDQYDLLSREDSRLFELYREQPGQFSTASTTDAGRRRETKIARFKQEKELKQKLEVGPTGSCIEILFFFLMIYPASKAGSTVSAK
jgi:immunoglobulin-binding protein 1